MTPNEIVSFNLRHARESKGWTQQEAADQLAPHLGEHWSRATYSFAERVALGGRPRSFSADELFAFALAFERPVTWFLLPPGGEQFKGDSGSAVPPEVDVPSGPLPAGVAVELVIGLDREVQNRINGLAMALPTDAMSGAQRQARERAREQHASYVAGELEEASELADALERAAQIIRTGQEQITLKKEEES